MSRPTRPSRPTSRTGRPSSARTASARSRSLAQTRTSPISTFGALGFVAVVLLAGLGYGYSTRSQAKTSVDDTAVRNLPVGSATAICQGEIGGGSDTSTMITTYSPGGTATGPKDAASIGYVNGQPFGNLKFGAPGTRSGSQPFADVQRAPDDLGEPQALPLVLQASGAYAPGFAASELLRSDSGLTRGLAAAPCTVPGTDFWFAGVSMSGDRDSNLELANPDDTPASVDLTFFGPDGKLDLGAAGHDITIQPHSFKRILLSTYLNPAPKTSMVASVRVATSQGRVAAQVLDEDKALGGGGPTLNGRGIDFIPGQAPTVVQQTSQVIPGIPALATGLQKFELVLTATGDQNASIDSVDWIGNSKITLSAQTQDPDPGYTKRDSPMTVPAGHTVVVNMIDVLRDKNESGALRITGSGGPFLAGVRLVSADQKTQSSDSAYLAPAQAVTGQAIVVDNNIGGAGKTSLLLTDLGDKGGSVKVTTIGADNKLNVDPVPLQPNQTLVYTPKATGQFTVVVEAQPGSDPVYGARILTDQPLKGGTQITAQVLVDARMTAAVPPVAADLSGAVGR